MFRPFFRIFLIAVFGLFLSTLPDDIRAQSVIFKSFSEVALRGEVDKRSSENSFALIIFNANYEQEQVPDLLVTENDAKAMEKLFIALGYPAENVKVLGNRSKTELEEEVFEFAGKLRKDATVAVYYSGHGITFRGDPNNYIVPADINPVVEESDQKRRERAIRRRVVNFETMVLDILKDAKPAGIVVFYDACRDAPFSVSNDKTKSLKPDSSFVPAKISGTAIFFSAKNGQQSIAALNSDGNDVNLSLFTRVLVSTLSENPSIRLRDLHPVLNARVSTMALKGTNGARRQEPDYQPALNYQNTKRLEFCLASVAVDGELRCTGPEGVTALRRPIIPQQVVQPVVVPSNHANPRIPKMMADFARAEKYGTPYLWSEFIKKYGDLEDNELVKIAMTRNEEQLRRDGRNALAANREPIFPAKFDSNGHAIMTRDQARTLQKAMLYAGHYAGPLDGAIGPMSPAAISRARFAAGLTPGSFVDLALLTKLPDVAATDALKTTKAKLFDPRKLPIGLDPRLEKALRFYGDPKQSNRVMFDYFQGHLYLAVNATMGTFERASADAVEAGGHLVTIQNAAENRFLVDFFSTDSTFVRAHQKFGLFGPMIGLYQPQGSAEPRGGWAWVTGEPLNFTAWSQGNPDNHQGQQHRARFYLKNEQLRPGSKAVTWDDTMNDMFRGRGYLVEIE